MKRTIEIDDREIIRDSLRDIRLYITGMYIRPDDSFITEDVKDCLIEYYRTDNPRIEAECKKIIATALIQSCNDCPDIPQKNKRKVAERMISEFFQCCEASKETYCCACAIGRYKGLAPGTNSSKAAHKQAMDEYSVVRKANNAIKFKTIVKKMGERIATKAAIGTAVFKQTGSKVLTTTAIMADIFMPKPVKEKMKQKAKQVGNYISAKVSDVVTTVKNKLNNTEVGQKIVVAVEKTSSVIHEVATGVKTAVTQAYTATKSFAQKGRKKLKSFFA